MHVEEKRLLALRLEQMAWVRQRDYLAIGLTLVIGILGYFLSAYLFNTSVPHRVQRIWANISYVGQPQPFEPSSKEGALECEVVLPTLG